MEQEKSERNPQREPQEAVPVNWKAKDTFFKKVYEKEERQKALISFLLGLDANKIRVANVRPILLGNKENDLALLCDDVFYLLTEEQSSLSPNIPYRLLEYITAGLRSLVDSEQVLYGKKRVYFPIPKLYLLQVGLEIKEEKLPEQIQYDIRLSDSYLQTEEKNLKDAEADLEVIVHVYDFRMTLKEILTYIKQNILPQRFQLYKNDMMYYALVANGITYMQRIEKDKKYRKPANVSTVTEYLEMMLERGIFVDLLSDKEVCDMTMAQFSRDDILLYQGREEGLEEGRKEGRKEGRMEGREEGKAQERAEAVLELLEEIGEPSETLRNYVMEQTNLEVLRKWHKIAARVDSIKDFEQAAVNINIV